MSFRFHYNPIHVSYKLVVKITEEFYNDRVTLRGQQYTVINVNSSQFCIIFRNLYNNLSIEFLWPFLDGYMYSPKIDYCSCV